MPGKKHLRGVGKKEQREYEHIKESAEKEGRPRRQHRSRHRGLRRWLVRLRTRRHTVHQSRPGTGSRLP
jgi:hypothetical protein